MCIPLWIVVIIVLIWSEPVLTLYACSKARWSLFARENPNFFSLASSRLSQGDTCEYGRISGNIVLHWSNIFHMCLLTYEWTLEGQAGGDGEGRVQAAEDGSQQHEFPDADVHR